MKTASSRSVLLILFFGVLMAAMDIAIVGPALPAIQKEFSIDSRALAWIFSIYILFNLASTPVMAKLSDRFGRRDIYVLDVTLFAIGSLVIVLSPDFPVLLMGRVIQAIGAGGIFPVAAAVIGDTFPPEKRGGALGLIGAVFGIAFLVGPILAGILLRFSWHWLFLINLPIAAVLIWQGWRLLPSVRPETASAFDFGGVIVLSVLLASLTLGITQIDSASLAASFRSPAVTGLLLFAVILAPLFWRIEKKAADPVLHPELFVSRQLILTSGIAAGCGVSEAATIFLPSLAVAGMGVSESTASFMLLPAVFALMIGAPLAGRLLDRIGSKFIIQAGIALTAAGFILFATATVSLATYVVAGALAGLGMSSLLGAPLRYVVLNEAGAGHRGAAQGLLTVFLSVGQLLGASVVGSVAASFGNGAGAFQSALLAIGVLTLILIPVSIGLKNRTAEAATAKSTP